jgi:hypothetical protein
MFSLVSPEFSDTFPNRLDIGSMGVGSVDKRFSGNRFGHVAITALAVKIAKDYDTDVFFEIVHGNTLARSLAESVKLHVIDTQSWVIARRIKKWSPTSVWGHM